MSEWIEFAEDWPTWTDAGKKIEMVTKGVLHRGVLLVDDCGFDGEDEYPIFAVKLSEGVLDFSSHDKYRFIE